MKWRIKIEIETKTQQYTNNYILLFNAKQTSQYNNKWDMERKK